MFRSEAIVLKLRGGGKGHMYASVSLQGTEDNCDRTYEAKVMCFILDVGGGAHAALMLGDDEENEEQRL